MAKPKLALIPATQGSKLLSVLPSSGVGDFDFTRSGKATRINSQGLIEEVSSGQSRLNYPMIDGKVVGCPHHILEPARTNLLSYSEDFSQSYWTKNGASVVSNNAISPDGTLNAFKFVENTNNGTHEISSSNISVTNGNKYTLSSFVKYDGREWVRIFAFDFARFLGSPLAYFNINQGVIGTYADCVPKIEDYGNGWYKISIVIECVSSGITKHVLRLAENDNDFSYQGDGTSGVYIYGAQLEQGSYPTSYIPTNGEANGVTRSAETAYGSGNADTFNDSEGVLMAEISALADDLTYRSISIGSGSGVINLFYNNVTNTIVASTAGGTLIIRQLSDIKNFNKIVFKYKQNDFSLWVNGFEIGTDASGTTGNLLTTLSFDNNAGGSRWYGKTKQLQYHNSILTDSELEQLTSWTSFTDMANGQLYTIE